MRDIALTVFILGSLPVILMRPHLGVLMWAWIGFMNPHRLTWGFAYDFPFAMVVGITTLMGLMISGDWRRMPWTREVIFLGLFIGWMLLTTMLALNQAEAWQEWDRVWKIQLMVLVSMMLLQRPERIRALVWVIVASIGFYGVKGGLFTIFGGGEYRVRGPEGSFIEGNNEIGLALIMVIPLVRYLQLSSDAWWVRRGMGLSMVLCGAAILGTHSRGAFIGIAIMLILLAAKSPKRVPLLLLIVLAIPAGLAIMPQHWTERMEGIRNYREDGSVMGRFNAWRFGWNIAKARPLIGGGFGVFTPELFGRFAPDPDDFHDSHSIYFEVLAEHGFVGLFLFLGVMGLTWLGCSWSIKQVHRARDDPDLLDCRDLARMLQVSVIGYAVSGAFLGLAYFDFYYNLVVLAVLTRLRVVQRLRQIEHGDELEALPEEFATSPRRRMRNVGRIYG